MKLRATAIVLATLAALTAVSGCSTESASKPDAAENDVFLRTNYEISWEQYNATYSTNFSTPEQAYSVDVKLGDKVIHAPSHLFGETVNVIPYSNDDGVTTADGRVLERGDSVIAQIFRPGEIGIAVKHHRSEFPVLDLDNIGNQDEMKEHFKLQDTHIEIVVGVQRDGKAGAITINNPQDYEQGGFGDETYAMVFLRPVYPQYLTDAQKVNFENNVRTMLLAFNAVTDFPGDYNGGDPLGARNPEKVLEYVKQMILAINGNDAALAWFKEPANQVYCAELAFIAFSAGLIAPLNDATIIPLVGAEEWSKFQQIVADHNAGKDTAFTLLNRNKRVTYVRDLTLAPPDLAPAPSYGPPGEETKLALEPLTQADMLDEFLRTHIPRELFGEELASAQAAVLAAMKPALLEQTRMNELPETDPRRVAVDALFSQLVEAVGKQYESYTAFREAIEPLLAQAREITGPRGDTGEGLFVPPSLFHVAAQGKRAGLLRFQYEGHGVHASAVKSSSAPETPPTPVEAIASEVSCQNQCGGQAAGGCYCDSACANRPEGCCSDFAAVCGGNSSENGPKR
ncbi:MAG TPA: hypothetical protein VM580_21050 [Labilithrix sp.]|nr:hypothetical protein [Labilithrix sp.]